MIDIESRDRRLIANEGRYYFARRLFIFLIILSFIGAIYGLFIYKGPHDPVEIAKVGIGGTFFWLFWANSMHLRIRHIESIHYYLGK